MNLPNLTRSSFNASQVLDLLAAVRSGELLDLVGAAAYLQASPADVRRWAAEGILPARLVGGRYVFEAPKLVEWMLRNQIAGQRRGDIPEVF